MLAIVLGYRGMRYRQHRLLWLLLLLLLLRGHVAAAGRMLAGAVVEVRRADRQVLVHVRAHGEARRGGARVQTGGRGAALAHRPIIGVRAGAGERPARGRGHQGRAYVTIVG